MTTSNIKIYLVNTNFGRHFLVPVYFDNPDPAITAYEVVSEKLKNGEYIWDEAEYVCEGNIVGYFQEGQIIKEF